MNKRISARAIIFNKDRVYTMFRRKLQKDGNFKEYYVLPGGGILENEDIKTCVLREIKEEFSVQVKVIEYLGKTENNENIAHFFHCQIVSGTPSLGGEELERCCDNNYYEIRLVSIKDLDNLDIMAKDMILKAYNKLK
ncbi:MAG: NUDIX domain-containing protein [Bacilli bacterium]|nr:NUDIX domain-containing protein [Bacilli bacterium]MDD4795379.1 NUDIX domain-containing protein [Bacilli bacterium]